MALLIAVSVPYSYPTFSCSYLTFCRSLSLSRSRALWLSFSLSYMLVVGARTVGLVGVWIGVWIWIRVLLVSGP